MSDVRVASAPTVLPRELRALGALTFYPLIAMMRNLSTFAFGFLFPVAFIGVFGLIGGSAPSTRIGIDPSDASSPIVQALEQAPGVVLVRADRADLERQLHLGKLEGIVTPRGSEVQLELNTSSPQSSISRLWMQSVVDQLNLRAGGVSVPAYRLVVGEVEGRRDRYIDFALPGMIGFALLSTAVFGTVFGLLFLKKTLILKRLLATPVRGITILLGQGLARLVVAILQAVIIVGVGVIAFGFQLANGWATFVAMMLLSALGLLVFLAFGILIAGRTNDENTASPLTNLFTLPQFLLSGVFFPTDVFPSWVAVVAGILPLSLFNSAMRQIATEGVPLTDILPTLLALCAWGVVAYALAARSFKWV